MQVKSRYNEILGGLKNISLLTWSTASAVVSITAARWRAISVSTHDILQDSLPNHCWWDKVTRSTMKLKELMWL
jgi:hypothetical protein